MPLPASGMAVSPDIAFSLEDGLADPPGVLAGQIKGNNSIPPARDRIVQWSIKTETIGDLADGLERLTSSTPWSCIGDLVACLGPSQNSERKSDQASARVRRRPARLQPHARRVCRLRRQ
ncbi:MAG: hypothetical protein MO852_08935 [Candidatus Devosia euplotis]|nr:hypothetical protein [Candidatus Devosia euplotis]